MISSELEYHAPHSITEVLGLLDAPGRDVMVLAGGMSLVPTMTLGLADPDAVVSLKRLDMSYVTITSTDVVVGATTTHSTLADTPEIREALPVLAECAGLIGDVQVRNRGTIGGSLAHADPAANYPPLALAVGATMVITSPHGERAVHADDFFVGIMETEVREGDVLTEVRFPRLPPTAGAAYREFVRVEGNFALVNACAVADADRHSGTVCVGGVNAVPARVDLAPALTSGLLDETVLDDLVDAAIPTAYDDINGSADYKRSLARTFARRAVAAALDRSNGGPA